MKLKGHYFSFKQLMCLALYYGIAIHLPASYSVFGGVAKRIRYMLVRNIFKKCGKNVNIEHGATFGRGTDIEIGDYSGIGVNAVIPSSCRIGKYVMMGPNCYVLDRNHRYDLTDKPMCFQGFSEKESLIIEDDVWIGRDVLMTPGRTIKRGSIIAAGCVLCKDFPEYSIIGGNPSRIIKSRLKNDKDKE